MKKWLTQYLKPRLWLSLAAGLGLVTAGAGLGLSHAATDTLSTGTTTPAGVFLQLDDVQGESTDAHHVNQISVDSFDWGNGAPGLQNPGSGGSGAGKVNVSDFHVTKHIDKSSPTLMSACATGKHFKSAIIVVRKAGGTQDYLTYKLTDVLVSSYQVSDHDTPTESLSFSFGKIEVVYAPQMADGSLGSPVQGIVDLPGLSRLQQ